jgi:hypothetical protein
VVLGQSKLFENQRAFFIYETAGGEDDDPDDEDGDSDAVIKKQRASLRKKDNGGGGEGGSGSGTGGEAGGGEGNPGKRSAGDGGGSGGEYAGDAEDLVLTFYPPDVSTDMQLFLVGAASALFFFANSFTSKSSKPRLGAPASTSAPVLSPRSSVIAIESTKMALRRVDSGVTMVLTGFIEESDEELLYHLEASYSALRFYHGSFSSIRRLSGSREGYLETVRRICLELIPLVSLPSFVLTSPKTPSLYSDLSEEMRETIDEALSLVDTLRELEWQGEEREREREREMAGEERERERDRWRDRWRER